VLLETDKAEAEAAASVLAVARPAKRGMAMSIKAGGKPVEQPSSDSRVVRVREEVQSLVDGAVDGTIHRSRHGRINPLSH